MGHEPDSSGIPATADGNPDSPLGRYNNQSVVITLPDGIDVYAIDYLSVWSKGLDRYPRNN